MSDGLEAYAALHEQIRDLQQSNARLTRALDKSKNAKAELVDAIYQAARDGIAGLNIGAVAPAKPDARKRTSETAIAVLSDWQLAKVTPTYNTAVCEERIQRYADKVIKLAGIQRADHPVRELRVYLLGDLVEGELIFPGQSHLIDASLYRQVLVDGPRILGDFLRRMATVFEKIHVVGVIGNHGSLGGRSRKDYHPESNADTMMYEATRMVMGAQKNITWGANMTPGERHWYAIDTIGTKRFMMFHGDQIKGGFGGFPWYGFGKKVQGWYMIHDQFDYAFSGHFHTPVRMFLNGVTLWGNGSTESSNTYADEALAAAGKPCQWLLFAHPEHGVTGEYLVHLEQ